MLGRAAYVQPHRHFKPHAPSGLAPNTLLLLAPLLQSACSSALPTLGWAGGGPALLEQGLSPYRTDVGRLVELRPDVVLTQMQVGGGGGAGGGGRGHSSTVGRGGRGGAVGAAASDTQRREGGNSGRGWEEWVAIDEAGSGRTVNGMQGKHPKV